MEKIRQFIDDEKNVVSCTWSERHEAWVCNSEVSQFDRCVRKITPLYNELHESGFTELHH